tara:strand:- start:352 stop:1095 length:744 start_codon:yes stop_codon:yes gene_type:complete
MNKIYIISFYFASIACYSQIAIGQTAESYELGATEYFLEEHSEITDFSLKLLDDGVEKKNDLSGTNILAFGVVDNVNLKNLESGVYGKPYVILELTVGNYTNDYGTKTRKRKYVFLDRSKWIKILTQYCNIALIEMHQIKNPYKIPDGNKKKVTSIWKLQFNNNGLTIRSNDQYQNYLKFMKLGGDDYRVSDLQVDLEYDFKLVYNEKSLGLYIMEESILFQLSRGSVNRIHSFFARGHKSFLPINK